VCLKSGLQLLIGNYCGSLEASCFGTVLRGTTCNTLVLHFVPTANPREGIATAWTSLFYPLDLGDQAEQSDNSDPISLW
jgi:hypothetical protein